MKNNFELTEEQKAQVKEKYKKFCAKPYFRNKWKELCGDIDKKETHETNSK